MLMDVDEDMTQQEEGQDRERARATRWRFAATALLVLAAPLALPHLLRLVRMKPAIQEELQSFAAQPFGIREVIRKVKEELQEADRERLEKHEGELFVVESFDLELHFVVEERASARMGAEPKLVLVSKDAEVSTQRVQTMKIHMVVPPPTTGEALVIDGAPRDRGITLRSPPPAAGGS